MQKKQKEMTAEQKAYMDGMRNCLYQTLLAKEITESTIIECVAAGMCFVLQILDKYPDLSTAQIMEHVHHVRNGD